MSVLRDLLREIQDANRRLLTEPQIDFLDTLLTVIKTEGKNGALDLLNDDKNNSILIQMREIQETFKSIIRHLKNVEASSQKFLKTYPRWSELREDSVVRLREIAKDINSNRFNCNVSQVVGHSASAVGGIMCLASAVSIPFTLGLTTPLAIAGGSFIAAGCSTSIGTTITEITLLKNKVSEAQEIVKNDKETYEELTHWLKRAQELEKALFEVLNINIAKDIKESVKKLSQEILKLYDEKSISKTRVIQGLQKILRFLPEPLKTSIPLSSIAPYIFILVALKLMYLNIDSRVVFDLVSVTLRGFYGICSLLDDTKDIARIASLFTKNTVLANNIGKAFVRGVFSAAGIALDVMGIVMTSIDLGKGSCAPEADKIEKAAEELEKEATLLKEVYENLMNPPAPKAKKRKPQIIIYNIWYKLRNEEREERISKDNHLDRKEIKVLSTFETERGCCWVLEVGAENFACIMRRRKIKFGIHAFKFGEYLKPVICYRCGAYGHKQQFCIKRQVCLRCGEEGHKYLECSNSFYHCINCSKHNEKYGTDFKVKHSCFSKYCRALKIEIDAIRDIIDYGGY